MNINSPQLKYLYAVLCVAAVTAIKYFLLFNIAVTVPFILFYVTVFLVAYLWGLKPAILAIICSTLSAVYFFMVPYLSFGLNSTVLTRVALFLIECGIILYLAATIQHARGLAFEEQKRYRLLIEKSNDGIALFDKSYKLVYISPSVEKVLGYTPEEYKKKDTSLLLFPDEVEAITKSIMEVLGTPGKSAVIEHRFRHKDGRWVYIETTLTNLLNEPGVNAVVSNFRDISDRMILAQQREDFIGIVSHELKTPLTTIKGYLQLAELHPDIAVDKVPRLKQQVNRMERMIQDLLDTTSFLKSKIHPVFHSCDLNLLVQDAVQSISLIQSKRKITTDLGELPPVVCDEYRISQVLTNFLTNAFKYSAENTPIHVSSYTKDDKVFIEIEDQGVGLNETQQQSVFKRFYRGVNNISGLGLGLYISAQIIELHNGEIGVISKEGKGSKFWFALPLVQ